jgi:hypothetical protein
MSQKSAKSGLFRFPEVDVVRGSQCQARQRLCNNALSKTHLQRARRLSMTSGFNVHSAAGYEQLMGRWSQKLAPPIY